jgi:GDP-4-dehydro-6-deoxy-D-mannose reductase
VSERVPVKRRLLVTGRHGFVGGTVAQLVASERSLAHWQLVPVSEQFELRDPKAVRALVADTMPDAVLHLAAQSSVAGSLRDPVGTIEVNVLGTLHLLQALQDARFTGPVLFVSSGDVYGKVPDAALPISERQLPSPRNPYAASKLGAEALCQQWTITTSMHVVIARPFNHIGPGQGDQFAIPAFAQQIADIRRGLRDPVVAVGDIDVTRDFSDVRDIVFAYFALLDHGRSGECYNVCSGRERTVRSLLERLIDLADVEVRIVPDETRMRPSEHRRAVGDATKIREATGWQPRMPLDESLSALLESCQRKGEIGDARRS